MAQPRAPLLIASPQGLYCPAGDFHIDPSRKVDRAVITHAHADHARRGHAHYLCAADGAAVLRARLGPISLQTLAYGEAVELNGVRLSLHPAGHVLGSAQVRVAHRGEVWVVSGDYFCSPWGDTQPGIAPFEPLRCDCFVTESTFAAPLYRWRPQAEVFAEIDAWWRDNAALGRPSVLSAYSLGKAQRLLAGIDASIGPIVVDPAVAGINAAYAAAGVPLPATLALEALPASARGRAIVIGGAAALGPEARLAFASGWMQLRSRRASGRLDRGFVLSDHADWPGLLQAIDATGAPRVVVTHGQPALLVQWLQLHGRDAVALDG